MKFLCFLSLVLVSFSSFSQGRKNKDVPIDTVWYEGAIIKNDGAKQKGMVRYNETLGLVNFLDANGEQWSFPATRIAGFEYFDPSLNKWRNLLSIENFNEQRSAMHIDFHEFVMEVGKLSVWSKKEPLFMRKEKHYSPGVMGPGTTPTPGYAFTSESLNRSEILYMMDASERFHWILKLESKENNIKHIPDDPATDKRGTVNMKIIEQLLGDEKVRQLQRFAKDNDLSWKKRDDLLKILAEADNL